MDNNMNNNPYQQPGQPQQPQYQQPVNQFQPTNQYQPQMPAYQPELEEPVSVGDWVGTMLLYSLVPCVGLIVYIVWAFSKDTKKSKANYCKACLLIMLIEIVLVIVLALIFGGTIVAAISSAGVYY